MGLFGGKERKRQAFVQKAEDLAGSLQMEFYKSSVSYLEKKYDHDTAVKISAALANFVFRFGHVSPQHASDAGLMATVAGERPKVLDSFSSIFKTNSTGLLILLGAAWAVNLTEFKRHMQALAEDGFAQVGRNTPNVQRDLPSADAVYMYELTTLPSPIPKDMTEKVGGRARPMIFSFGRKAQFEKLVQELKVFVLSESIGFAAMVAEEVEGLAAKGSLFSGKPPAYQRFFSSVAPPKSDTTIINQMTLFLGAFSFFWHAIDRYSFRKDNLALRVAILDPVVFGISKGIVEIMNNKGTKTTTEKVVAAARPMSLRYAGARSLADPQDVQNSAVWLAGRVIVEDTELQLTEAEGLTLRTIVVNKLLESIVKIELPKRVKVMETLLIDSTGQNLFRG